MKIKNVHGNTLDLLGEAIVAGHYAAGAVLPSEPLLCEQLGVSRTVVREAVKSLAAKGLLRTGPKVGTRVQPPADWNWFDPDLVAWQSKAGLTRDFCATCTNCAWWSSRPACGWPRCAPPRKTSPRSRSRSPA